MYASELFTKYITKHKAVIKSFLKRQDTFNKLPILSLPSNITHNYGPRYYFKVTEKITLYFELQNETEVKAETYLEGVTPKTLGTKFDQKIFNKAVAELIKFRQYQKDATSFNNMQSLMDSCEL